MKKNYTFLIKKRAKLVVLILLAVLPLSLITAQTILIVVEQLIQMPNRMELLR